MVDHNLVVKQLLGAATSVTTLLGSSGIVAGELPEKFEPLSSGPCIVVCTEGGSSFENAPIQTARVKVRVWAGINQYVLARQVYRALHDILHGVTQSQQSGGFILHSTEEVGGQDLTDPDTGWATVLSYYSVTARE